MSPAKDSPSMTLNEHSNTYIWRMVVRGTKTVGHHVTQVFISLTHAYQPSRCKITSKLHRRMPLPTSQNKTVTSNFSLPNSCALSHLSTAHETRHVQKVSRSNQVTILSVSYPFKAYLLCGAPTGLTFKNFYIMPHYIGVFCIYLTTNSEISAM